MSDPIYDAFVERFNDAQKQRMAEMQKHRDQAEAELKKLHEQETAFLHGLFVPESKKEEKAPEIPPGSG